jgi:uncharacterized phage protein gp47/JayE
MVYTAEEEFPEGKAVATSQMRRHCNVVQGGLVGFATEDKSAQPHIQECSVFNITKGIVFHVLQDVILISVPWLYPCLPRGILEFPRLDRPGDVKAGNHIHIGQGWRHWAMAKKEGIDTV